MSKPKPPAECLAIIICEGVVEDARSHNKCILNIFNGIQAPNVPTTHDKLVIFLALTDIHGELPLRLTFGPEGQEPVMELTGSVKSANPLNVADLIFNLRNVPLGTYGTYVATAWVNDTIVGVRRLRVVKPRGPGGQNG